jgi:hypothetical protein
VSISVVCALSTTTGIISITSSGISSNMHNLHLRYPLLHAVSILLFRTMYDQLTA